LSAAAALPQCSSTERSQAADVSVALGKMRNLHPVTTPQKVADLAQRREQERLGALGSRLQEGIRSNELCP
jgi:hypothetical protein